jgi:predicted alpha/beta-fold hydrolase
MTAAVKTNMLEDIGRVLRERPFIPHPSIRGGHAQTLAGRFWPRRLDWDAAARDEERLFEVAPDVKLLARCRWQKERRKCATAVIWHGLEGSTESRYVMGLADKAFRAGFNAVRVNQRNCGGTEHLTPTLYSSLYYPDLGRVVSELIQKDGLAPVLLIGVSMTGNMALYYAGKMAAELPDELAAIAVMSPSVDLQECSDLLHERRNRVYSWHFIRRLKMRVRLKHKLFPEIYDLRDFESIRTIRDFDERITARYMGFPDAATYYAECSARPYLGQIQTPTLIVHAQDDPFVPFGPMNDAAVRQNPNILLLEPERGGHVGFIADKAEDYDRFWAETRMVEFCRLMVERLANQKFHAGDEQHGGQQAAQGERVEASAAQF